MARYWRVLPGLLVSTHRFYIVEQAGKLPVAREQRKWRRFWLQTLSATPAS